MPSKQDRIVAIATAQGRGGVGVIRLSGPALLPLAVALSGRTPQPRLATLADFKAADGSVIDTGLLLYFPAPHSFTGEDVLELQGHGGPVVMQLLLGRCVELGIRLAAPGEFSQRAFLNGKMDLAQAEAVADLIDATTAAAARSAIRSLQGEFSRAIHGLVEELTQLRMLVEATLDFPEEEIDFLQAADAFGRMARLHDHLLGVFDRASQGKLLQTGMQVVLVGQPNVGKSSLLNRLAGDDLAIVTPIAGTTRDALRTGIQIEGVPLHIIDTAGLRETEDEVEKIGIARTWQEVARADVALVLMEASCGLTADDRLILAKLPANLKVITVCNKADLGGYPCGRQEQAGRVTVTLSARTGEGMDTLRQELLALAGWHQAEDVFIARERHLEALREATGHLDMAYQWIQGPVPALEFFAEELRLTQVALGQITGEFTPDDLLGVIFSRFCIGK